MLAVICHLWGTRYNEGHVRALKAMAEAHIRVPHRFVCITDRDKIDGIETVPLRWIEGRRGNLANFSKINAFDGALQRSIADRIVCMDLDVVVLDDLTDLVMGCGEFAIMEGTTGTAGRRLAPYNSSMWVCEAGARHHIYADFSVERIADIDAMSSDGYPVIGTDQAWIALCSPGERTFGAAEGIIQYATAKRGEASADGMRAIFFAGRTKPWDKNFEFSNAFIADAWQAYEGGIIKAGLTGGHCLVLGYASHVWDDLEAVLDRGPFDAVIASPEAAEYWPGDVTAIARDDEHADRLVRICRFRQVTWCGRSMQNEDAA